MQEEKGQLSGLYVKIIRADRKSIAAKLLDDGRVEVRAPVWVSDEFIVGFLLKNEQRLHDMAARRHDLLAKQQSYILTYGSKLLFLGKRYPVVAAADGKNCFDGQTFFVKDKLSQEEMRKAVARLFTELARSIFEEKLNHYAALIGVSYSAFAVGSAKKRHGSCASNGKITLSWRIIMMSEYVIDYIVVHELAHIKQMNHSAAFYAEVAKVLPDYQLRRKSHRDYSLLLREEGWM